jgi:hypothetical protein
MSLDEHEFGGTARPVAAQALIAALLATLSVEPWGREGVVALPDAIEGTANEDYAENGVDLLPRLKPWACARVSVMAYAAALPHAYWSIKISIIL